MAGGFHIKVDSKDVMRTLWSIRQEHSPEVTKRAINLTAGDIKADEQTLMHSVFDRPTRFTLNSLFVRFATTDNLTASVEFKEGFGSVPAWRYLGPQVEGGGRKKKGHERALERAGILKADEYAVPGARLATDAHGNVPGSVFTRILSQLQASSDPLQNATQSKRSKASRKRAGSYFVLRGAAAPDGIYWRQGREMIAALLFVKQPKYKKRFPFYETAQRVFNQRFAMNARAGWDRVLAKLNKAA